MTSIALPPRARSASDGSLDSSPSSPTRRRRDPVVMAARDTLLLRLLREHDPFHAPRGEKGVAWVAVSRGLRAEGVKWQPLMCRSRLNVLLDKLELHRAGKGTPQAIAMLDADVVAILEDTLRVVASTRIEAQIKSKEKALVAAQKPPKPRDEKKAEREHEAKMKLKLKERDEKRAAAVIAAAARERDVVVNTATVVAKRRKRKGVKSKEEKRASGTSEMFDALRQSREEYLNQLRVQTAAEAAAEAGAASVDNETPPSAKKPRTKLSTDLDLTLLRAVSKCSPFSQETKQETEKQWVAVADRVFKYCNLKFTTTGVRDRCEALIKDFEANDCKRSTFSSGVVVADEERLSLLRVIRKAYKRRARSVVDRGVKSPEASQIEKNDSAIEIEDEPADDSDPQDDGLEQWGSLEENRLEDELDDNQRDEQVEESLVEDTQDEEDPEPSGESRDDSEEPEQDFSGRVVPQDSSRASKSMRKRRRSESGASPDADPAVDMDIEQLQLDDNSLDWSESQDFTPRKYKQPRKNDVEEDGKTEENATRGGTEHRVNVHQQPASGENYTQLASVIELVKGEREERREEFKAMLDLIKQQNKDHRTEWQREHERRTLEQKERQRETTSLVHLLTKERKDRKSEMLTMLEAMNKDREDRREEFKAMMALMTRMVEARQSS